MGLPAASGEQPQASSLRQAASGEQPQASSLRQAASGKQPQASSLRESSPMHMQYCIVYGAAWLILRMCLILRQPHKCAILQGIRCGGVGGIIENRAHFLVLVCCYSFAVCRLLLLVCRLLLLVCRLPFALISEDE